MLAPCDLLELRVDSLRAEHGAGGGGIEIPDLDRPLLLTVRHPAEGGQGSLTPTQRRSLHLRYLPRAELVDVEIRSMPSLADVIDEARHLGVPWVASFHDFARTPSAAALRRRVDRALDLGADVVKIAVRIETCAELARLASLYASHPGVALSLMGMGPLGGVSRILLGQLGSRLNYGHLATPNAPGQPPVSLLSRCRRELS